MKPSLLQRGNGNFGDLTPWPPDYFEKEVIKKRSYIKKEWCIRVIENPLKSEPQGTRIGIFIFFSKCSIVG
jgi:hypothetical protein